MDTTPWVGWKHGQWKTGKEKPGTRKNRGQTERFLVFSEEIGKRSVCPRFFSSSHRRRGWGPRGQREVAAFLARQRLGRQRGGLLDGERAAVQRDGALPAFAGELQRTAVLADLDRAGLREDSGLGEEVGVGVLPETGDRRNVFWLSPKKSENVPSVPGFSPVFQFKP
jgi:hypothetical protein